MTQMNADPRRSTASLPVTAAWTLFLTALFLTQAALAVPPLVPAGKTREIAADVHLIPDQGVALVPNVGIVVGSERVLVVDTGMGPRNAETVLAEVRRITDLPIGYLVSTHFHPEHNFGAQSFPSETILIYPISQQRDLQRKGQRYREWFVELFGDDVRDLLEPVVLVEPDVTFERRAAFDLGGLPVELHHFGRPAHTGGDTVVFLPRQKIAFVGGLVPNGFFPIMPDEDSSVDGWLETLDRIEALGAKTIVPGHGKVAGRDLIATVRDYLQSVRSRTAELRSQGATLEAAQDRLFSELASTHPSWGEPHWIRNAVERAWSEAAAD